ncbi:MAG: tetratricopeptide repeat protein, partial [Planctomycetales bacterium]
KHTASLLTCAFLIAGIAPGFVLGEEAEPVDPEITLSDREIRRLDVFEDRALSGADAAFHQKNYADALGLYDGFLKKFPKSTSAAYVTYRKARCSELAGRLAEAAADYQATAKKYPTLSKYAIPAIYRQAECQLGAGERAEALANWTLLAENAEYRESPLAARAITRILAALEAKKDDPASLKYYERIALKWKLDDEAIMDKAITAVTRQHVRVEPSEEKLKAFYLQLHPKAAANLDKTPDYLIWLGTVVLQNGKFGYFDR